MPRGELCLTRAMSTFGLFCFCGAVVLVLYLYCRNYPSKTAFLALAASEKNFLGRVLKYTPFGNFYLPCQRQKILFLRILPAPSLLSMPVGLALLANGHGASR
ncbi:MAG: hypothetical protein K2J64_02160, partial [Desulfovibrio sp.]|nr:hypothetical protein [Desulfovibrio sp.]